MLAGGMKSPWDDDTRNPEDHDLFRDGRNSELLGQILERASSAPPLPSETKGGMGVGMRYTDDAESYLFAVDRQRSPTSRLGFIDDDGRGPAPVPSTDRGGYIPRYNDGAGRSTAPGLYGAGSFDEPLFGSRSRGSLIDEEDRHADEDVFLFQRQQIPRSQSAAPLLLRESKSLGPPPGYGMNRLNTNDEYSPFKEGMQRSASTGVIGGMQKSSSSVLRSLGLDSDESDLGAVRPAPKTLMDLIQEDFPTTASPVYKSELQDDSYRIEYQSRPRTTSPPSQYGRADNGHYVIEQADRKSRMDGQRYGMEQQGSAAYGHQDALGEVPHFMDRMSVSTRDGYAHEQDGIQYVSRPQRHELAPREYAQELRAQCPIYAPVERNSYPQLQPRPQQAGQYYQSQPIYYINDRQPRPVAPMNVVPATVQAQVLPSGQPMYVNGPTYGYSTPHYHQGAAQQRIVHVSPHQSIQGGHPSQEYISVVPVQGGQMAQVSSPGAYAYWQQQEVSPQSAQTLSPNAYGEPSSIRLPMGPQAPGGRRQKSVRSPSEKGITTRRGGRGRRGGADPHKHPTSGPAVNPLLEEFRASKSRDWSIIDIKGHVVEFCQDQNGSRFIQQRLEIGDLREKEIVISEVLPEVQQLRNDVFGNYVVQKLLEFGTTEMRAELRDTLKGEMLALSLQMYGCRVVQKALEMLVEADLPHLLLEFHHNVLSCIQDQNGNHVIQKCVEVASAKAKDALASGDQAKAEYFSEQIDFIVDDVLANVASLSCHPYGCRVLQRILEHCVEPKKMRTLDEIRKCHRQLLDDQYGNYVIQHVLQYGRHVDRESILIIVVDGGLLALSKQKFASNVVEKLLKYGSPEQRNTVVREMLKKVDENTGAPMEIGGTSVALLMVRDAYANYVVQTALDVVPEGEEKRMLLEELTSHSSQLRNYTFAKHIVTKLGA